MTPEALSSAELSRLCEDLQRQVGRHIVVEQELVLTRNALDRELARLRAIQGFSRQALGAETLAALAERASQAAIEAFELDQCALVRVDSAGSQLEVLGAFGTSWQRELPWDAELASCTEATILEEQDIARGALRALGLCQVIVCPVGLQGGRPIGLLVGGRSLEKRAFTREIRPELRTAFAVLAEQVGALCRNLELNVLIRERKTSVLFHRTNDGIVLLDAARTIVDLNERAQALLGPREALLGQELFAIVLEAERAGAGAALEKLGAEGSVRLEACLLGSDGNVFPAELSASLFDLEPGQQMVHVLVRDLTELKRSQRQLILSERMAALGQLIAGIAHEINTPIGVVQAAVGNIQRAIARTLDELPPLLRRLSDADAARLLGLIGRARVQREAQSTRAERATRREIAATLAAAGVEDADADAIAEALVTAGITEGISADVDLLRQRAVVDAVYDLSALGRNAQNIKTAVERASKIVFALRKFVHLDRRGELVAVDVLDGIETVLTLYQSKLGGGVEGAIELERRFEADLPMVACSPDELGQVWTNLIDNAIHAMGGRGRLEVEVRREGGGIAVRFIDTGSGVAPDIMDRVFEPFFTTKAAGEGTGLGLDICRRIVEEKHHGKLTLESRPGRTVATVLLPIGGRADG